MTLVAGKTPALPLGPAAAPGTAAPEGSRADHVHPVAGLAVLASPNTFAGSASFVVSGAAVLALSTDVVGDTAGRMTAAADGTLTWGSGNGASDVTLARTAPRQLTLSGSLVVRNDQTSPDEPELVIDSLPPPSLHRRSVRYTTNSLARWALDTDTTTESGANSGSVFGLDCYSDTGTFLRNAFAIVRNTGDWIMLALVNDARPRMAIGDSAVTPGTKLTVRSSIGAALGLVADAKASSAPATAMALRARSSSAKPIADGFGPIVSLAISGSQSMPTTIATFGAVRQGASTSGDVVMSVASAGAAVEVLRVSAAGNVGINTGSRFAGGSGVIGIANAVTPPTSAPVGGGVVYAQAGALIYLNPSGTRTVVAPA